MNIGKHNRIAALFLLGVFTFFYCGNALFLHTHRLGAQSVVHSHPYVPGGAHSHTGQSLDIIANFNAVIAAMEASGEVSVPEPYAEVSAVGYKNGFITVDRHIELRLWRAPPMA